MPGLVKRLYGAASLGHKQPENRKWFIYVKTLIYKIPDD